MNTLTSGLSSGSFLSNLIARNPFSNTFECILLSPKPKPVVALISFTTSSINQHRWWLPSLRVRLWHPFDEESPYLGSVWYRRRGSPLPSAPKDFPPVWVKPPLASGFVPIPEDPPESTDLLTISSPQRLFKVCEVSGF